MKRRDEVKGAPMWGGAVVIFGLVMVAWSHVALAESAVDAGLDDNGGAQATASDEETDGEAQLQSIDEPIGDRPRGSIATMSRAELEAEGFVFEDTVTQQARAHATLFAFFAGVIVPGAGHWQLDDSRTALALVGTDLVGWTMVVTAIVLRQRPTGHDVIDDRRYDLGFVGTGLLATTWLVDIFGTAYRDDLGIPTSTRRDAGWGLGMRYEYLRPEGLSLRHVATTEVSGRSPGQAFETDARISQELGWGMSDYELQGRWYPFVGSRPETRLGIGVSGRHTRYRLDVPFQGADATGRVVMSLNLGQLVTHLDQMTAGLSVGLMARGQRSLDEEGAWRSMEYAGTTIPMRLSLALNLTDQLRMKTAYERGMGSWVERRTTRIGIPSVELMYRSTDRIDLRFQSTIGNGLGLSAGLRFWFGE